MENTDWAASLNVGGAGMGWPVIMRLDGVYTIVNQGTLEMTVKTVIYNLIIHNI